VSADPVELLVQMADALEVLGPERAGFSLSEGFILDGRTNVMPAEILLAAVELPPGPPALPSGTSLRLVK
jgi:hypothetical protein